MAEQRILIVEDDPDIRDGVRILLAGEGYRILEAENGLRALELMNPEVDLVDHLQQRGFVCVLDLGGEDPVLTVKGQYVRRILDNITSNAVKYADPGREIDIRFVREGEKVGLSFWNGTLPASPSAESTKVGLTSMQTMMEKMNGIFRVGQGDDWFCVTLLFAEAQAS